MFKKVFDKLFNKHKNKIRVDYKEVPYHEAEQLLKEGWTLAAEEDHNHRLGIACVEKLEEVS